MLKASPKGGSQLDHAKAALIRSIQDLPARYSFNVEAFDCSSRRWSALRQKAESGAKASAIAWVQALQASGGTGTASAVAEALNDRENHALVVLSNALPDCAPPPSLTLQLDPGAPRERGGASARSLRQALGANAQKAAIHCLGLSASGSFESFCAQLAAQSEGLYFRVP